MLDVFHHLDITSKSMKEKFKGSDCKKLLLAFKSNVFGGSVVNPVCVQKTVDYKIIRNKKSSDVSYEPIYEVPKERT